MFCPYHTINSSGFFKRPCGKKAQTTLLTPNRFLRRNSQERGYTFVIPTLQALPFLLSLTAPLQWYFGFP
jgi:hypothetical protein